MKIDVYETDAALGKCAPPPAAEQRTDALTISFDPTRLDRDRVHAWLSREAYWSIGLPRAVFDRAVDNSLVACAFVADEQVGFARIVTDRATYAWLCDVFVAPRMRGRGIAAADQRDPRSRRVAGTAPLGAAHARRACAVSALRFCRSGGTAALNGKAQSGCTGRPAADRSSGRT